jgi:uncharacterized membrane protein
MIQVGALKMTHQAFIIAVIGALTGIFAGLKGMAVPGLIVMAGAFLAAYNVNCTVVGHCDIWAWTLVVIYAINLFMIGKLAMEKKIKFM